MIEGQITLERSNISMLAFLQIAQTPRSCEESRRARSVFSARAPIGRVGYIFFPRMLNYWRGKTAGNHSSNECVIGLPSGNGGMGTENRLAASCAGGPRVRLFFGVALPIERCVTKPEDRQDFTIVSHLQDGIFNRLLS